MQNLLTNCNFLEAKLTIYDVITTLLQNDYEQINVEAEEL